MEHQMKLMRTLYITDLLNYNIHLGTYAKKTNAKMRPFIMGKYHGYAIINIFKTYVHLLRIKLFLTKIIINTGNSNVLFISTDKLLAPVIEQLATMCMSSYINDVCKGGILTNFKFVSKRKKKKSTTWQPRFTAESKNLNNRKNEKPKHTFYDSKQEKEKIFKALRPASRFYLPSIKRKIILNKLYKISHLSDARDINKLDKEQYVNKLRILEKKKKIIIKNHILAENNSESFQRDRGKTGQLPKIKRKIVLKKFAKVSDSNQITLAPVQKKISKVSDLNNPQLTNQYLLKVIGKKIYKIYRPKPINFDVADKLVQQTDSYDKTKTSGSNQSIFPSSNLLNLPPKNKSNKKIKSVCRKPRLKRISSSKLSKALIKDIYKVYSLEPVNIKILNATNQNEIKTFPVNKLENKILPLPASISGTEALFDRVEGQKKEIRAVARQFTNSRFCIKNAKPGGDGKSEGKSGENLQNRESKEINLSRPNKKIVKREFYSFLDNDIQGFFYPDVLPITMEQYQKELNRDNKIKKIFNRKNKIDCQFEEKKYEYIKTGLLNFPQIVIIVGQQKEMKIIKECQKLNILTISIADSDGDPSLTNLFIPGNDDHPVSVEYMLKHLAEATEIGKIMLNYQNSAVSEAEKLEEKKKKTNFIDKKNKVSF